MHWIRVVMGVLIVGLWLFGVGCLFVAVFDGSLALVRRAWLWLAAGVRDRDLTAAYRRGFFEGRESMFEELLGDAEALALARAIHRGDVEVTLRMLGCCWMRNGGLDELSE